MSELSQAKTKMHVFPDFYNINDVLMTIIVMLKFTQSLRPTLRSNSQLSSS